MPASIALESISRTEQRTELWFRRFLIIFGAAAALCMFGHLGMLVWAENGFTGPECVVAGQSMMLAKDGTLYYDLNHYPYTVTAYTPVFYWLEGGLYKLGLTAYMSGRLISFAALLGICGVVWSLLTIYTNNRYYAWLGGLMCASSSLLLYWGTVGQVDVLAAFWALAAFYQYSRYAVRGERSLVWTGVLAVLAFFTKQTMVACPVAIFLLLWFHRRKVAVKFAFAVGGAALLIAMSLNAALGGRFLTNTVLANLNPYSADKLLEQLRYALFVAGPLLLIVAAAMPSGLRTRGRALFAYLGTAVTVFAVTAPKVGSDLNYQIETTILLILCTCIGLDSVNFLDSLLANRKTWVTLLQLPVALFLVVNYRATIGDLLLRFSAEQASRMEIAALGHDLAGPPRVLSADFNALVRLRGRIDLEMLIYKLSVDAGIVNPEPVERDIADGAFSTIVLFQDVQHPQGNLPAEISTLPASQIEQVRKHYKLTRHVSGPVWDGIYVYKPRTEEMD